MWGFSSAGRAPALHAGGQEFESPNLHHKKDNDICYCPFYFAFLNMVYRSNCFNLFLKIASLLEILHQKIRVL